jgi:CHAD domain-containing protein
VASARIRAGPSAVGDSALQDLSGSHMSELQPDQSGLREVRRILLEWITAAAAILGKKRITDADIHDARKQLKKARAALRLLRRSIGEIAYRRENAALRDAARPLGVARDSRVLVAALDALAKRHKSIPSKVRLDKFRRILRQQRIRSRRALTPALITKQRAALRAVIKRSERWRLQGDDWDVIGDGLMRSYRRARKSLATAKQSRDTECLHDWRKQVKYLWHQLQILTPMRPGKIDKLADRYHALADHLGDDHDLAVLRLQIESHAEAFERTRDLDELLRRLDRRRIQLQNKAFGLGSRLFADKPPVFTQPLSQSWRAWRASSQA